MHSRVDVRVEHPNEVFRSDRLRVSTLIACLLLVAATIAAYVQVTSHPFTYYDDQDYVMNNSHITHGLDWESLHWAFTTFTAGNWHPLTWVSHILDVRMFGVSPGGHHAVNLLLHIVNALLVFWVLWRATGYSGRSLMVASFFALHPINVESVAWIAERKNLLSMCFFLLALCAYRWYSLKPGTRRYCVIAFLFACGLMAKPQVITLPLVLLLWDYWPLRRMRLPGEQHQGITTRSWSELLLEKMPLLALSAASALVTLKAQAAGGAVSHPAWTLRLENIIVSYTLYLQKAFWPTGLAPMYVYSKAALNIWHVMGCLALLLAITILIWRGRRLGYLPVGWFWFLGTLVPMIGVVQVGWQAMADRYAYLPFVGLFLIVCWGVCDLCARLFAASFSPDRARRLVPAEATLGIAALLPLAILTHAQVQRWDGNVGLWTYTLQVTHGNYVAEGNLGVALEKEGKPIDAMPHFFRAVELYPADPTGNFEIAMYYQRMGMLPEAVAQDRKLLTLPLSDGIRAEVLSNLGYAYGSLGQYQQARSSFEEAVKSNPNQGRAWMGLGVVKQRAGDMNGAVDAYVRSVKESPSSLIYLLLSRALLKAGREAEAHAALRQASLLSTNLEQTKRAADSLLGP
jgi:protein O-mannosyl-transferase